MKRSSATGIAFLMTMAVLTGCSGDRKLGSPAASTISSEDSEMKKVRSELTPEQVPVVISGHEIIVDTTTIQELLDDGFSLMVSEWNGDSILQHELDPKETLRSGTKNSEISFWITDAVFARVTIEAGTEDIQTGDAAITRFELHLSHEVDTLPEDIYVNGVSVSEFSRAKAGELFPDFEQGDLSVTCRGTAYQCSLLFSPKTLNLYQFSFEYADEKEPEPEIKVPSLW